MLKLLHFPYCKHLKKRFRILYFMQKITLILSLNNKMCKFVKQF